MEDLVTTVGLTILAVGLVLLMRSRGQRRLIEAASHQAQGGDRPSPASTSSSISSTEQQAQNSETKTAPLIVPMLELPTIDTPLATSLNVRDMVEPHQNSTEMPSVQYVEPGAGDTAGIPLDDAMPHHSDRQTVLDEINHMGETGRGDAIARLSHHLEDPDYMVRTAVASALGELATQLQGPRREEAVAHLQHLSQDASPEVRGQAATALSRLGT